MSNSNETVNADSNNINTKLVIFVICSIVLVVVAVYVNNFYKPLNFLDFQSLKFSKNNATWGTFGDYFGGILNPVIAGFAFYLIAKTYELQKRELEETRKLLQVSTDAQKDQIKLAALTALINSNFSNISFLQSQILFFWKEIDEFLNDKEVTLKIKGLRKEISNGSYYDPDCPDSSYDLHIEHEKIKKEFKELITKHEIVDLIHKIDVAESEVDGLIRENNKLNKEFKSFIPDSKQLQARP